MNWFMAWKRRRAEKKLRTDFDDFYGRSNFCRGMPKADAFKHFCALERLGPAKVRSLLENGIFD